jgi:hypothetical protein
MILYPQRTRQPAVSMSAVVGVFEDDVWLLRLTERSRLTEPGCRHVAGCFGSDGLGVDGELPDDASAWDF